MKVADDAEPDRGVRPHVDRMPAFGLFDRGPGLELRHPAGQETIDVDLGLHFLELHLEAVGDGGLQSPADAPLGKSVLSQPPGRCPDTSLIGDHTTKLVKVHYRPVSMEEMLKER